MSFCRGSRNFRIYKIKQDYLQREAPQKPFAFGVLIFSEMMKNSTAERVFHARAAGFLLDENRFDMIQYFQEYNECVGCKAVRKKGGAAVEYVYLLLLLGVVIAFCVFINRVTDKLKIPSLLLFIGLGVLFGVLLRPQIGNFTDYSLGNAVCFRVSGVRYLLRRLRHKLQGSAPRGGARRAPLLCGDGADGGADGRGRVCRVSAAAFRKDRLGGEYAHRVRALLYGRGLRL